MVHNNVLASYICLHYARRSLHTGDCHCTGWRQGKEIRLRNGPRAFGLSQNIEEDPVTPTSTSNPTGWQGVKL